MAASPPAPTSQNPETWIAALSRVMARVTANADREGVVGALANGLVDEFGIALARIWLYDPADDAIHLRAAAGIDSDLPRMPSKVPLRTTDLRAVQAIARRELLVVDEITDDSGLPDPAWARRQGLCAYAGFPLVVGDRLCGAMYLFSTTPWPPSLLDTLGALAQQAALALEHARLIEESRALQQIAAELASARDADVLMTAIVERTMAVVGADAGTVWLLEPDGHTMRVGASCGLSDDFFERTLTIRARTYAEGRDWVAFAKKPLFTADTAASVRRIDEEWATVFEDEGIVSSLRLPLLPRGESVTGWLLLYHRRERLYSESEIRFAQAFADQLSMALFNARLAEQERAAGDLAARQLERLQTLTRITERLLAATEVDDVLRIVVRSAWQLCEAQGAMVALADASGRQLHTAAFDGSLGELFLAIGPGVELTDEYLATTLTGKAIASGEVMTVENYAVWPPNPGRNRAVAGGVRALIAAPLRIGSQTIGVLWVGDEKPRTFATEDLALIEALAKQVSLAIEHTRLVTRSQDAAVLEERARLARDLHDSVTQQVFSLGMLARAAQTQHERGVPALAGTLDRIGTLAQDALAEMRALLFELRPGALAEEGLAGALEKLVAAMRVRADAPVTFQGTCTARLESERETAVFRIVQEALSNATKHARATQISVLIEQTSEHLRVIVEDNGAGFDPNTPAPSPAEGGGMGMRSMRERATAAGLDLRVRSAPGSGTSVAVEAPIAAD